MGEAKIQIIENMEFILMQLQGGALPIEMLKMKVDPGMCMKTQVTTTKCHAKNAAFCRKMH